MSYKSEYPGLLFEKKGHIAYITFNNPKVLNAISYFMFDSLNEVFDEMSKDRDVWAVILTGAGEKSFMAGADLKGDATKVADKSAQPYFPAEANRDFRKYIHATYNKIANFERPTVAAINGYCLGGGAELALCCDFRIASRNAKIGYPEVNIGGIAAYVGISRAARILGPTAAKEMLMSGKHYTAEEAKGLGFVRKVVEQNELIPACEEYLSEFLKRAPIAVKFTKIMVDRCLEMSYESSCEFERVLCSFVCGSDDYIEGVTAFKEKRPPEWKNN